MPLHVLLYEAMNWEAPEFAHLSLILKPEGKGKLSKRDGAKFGFPVFPMDFKDPESDEVWKGYKESGYFPEAFINMTALLGWTPANDKEIISLDEMIAEFDLHKVHKAGARFDPQKAKWFNQEYLKLKSDEEVLVLLKEIDEVNALNLSDDKLLKIISLMKERATFVVDIYNDGKFFFEAPTSYDEKATKKAWNETTSAILKDFSTQLETSEFDSDTLKEVIHHFAEEHSIGMGKLMMPLRLALVGELKGPDVPDIMNIIGKEETIARIEKAIRTN